MILLTQDQILIYHNKFASFGQKELLEQYSLAIEEQSFDLVKFFIVHSQLDKDSLSDPLDSSLRLYVHDNFTVESIADDKQCLDNLGKNFINDIFLIGLEYNNIRFLKIALYIAKEPITEYHFNIVKDKYPQHIDFFNYFVECYHRHLELHSLNKTLLVDLKKNLKDEKKIKI